MEESPESKLQNLKRNVMVNMNRMQFLSQKYAKCKKIFGYVYATITVVVPLSGLFNVLKSNSPIINIIYLGTVAILSGFNFIKDELIPQSALLKETEISYSNYHSIYNKLDNELMKSQDKRDNVYTFYKHVKDMFILAKNTEHKCSVDLEEEFKRHCITNNIDYISNSIQSSNFLETDEPFRIIMRRNSLDDTRSSPIIFPDII